MELTNLLIQACFTQRSTNIIALDWANAQCFGLELSSFYEKGKATLSSLHTSQEEMCLAQKQVLAFRPKVILKSFDRPMNCTELVFSNKKH